MKNIIKKNNDKGIAPIITVIIIVAIILIIAISISAVFIIQKNNKKKTEQQNNEQIEENEIFNEQENTVEETKKENIDAETGWDLDKVSKVISNDNIKVPVPIGYTASTIEGEQNVLTGFVIKEGNDGSKTTGVNEFVWIPIYNMEEIYNSTNNVVQLWDFGTPTSPNSPATKRINPTTRNNGYREPDVVTNATPGDDSTKGTECDAVIGYLMEAGFDEKSTANDLKTQLQSDYEEMIRSVKKYGGFYIGRYETGNLSLKQGNKAVVQKYNIDISGKDWYTQYKMNKTIAANENVKTGMIWGSQWDATLLWMQRYGTEDVKEFVINSKNHGNFKDIEISYKINDLATEQIKTAGVQGIIPTGSSEKTKVNNIYDMAGNVTDWTLEAAHSHSRTHRGGSYDTLSTYNSVGTRITSYPINKTVINGSRASMIIKL